MLIARALVCEPRLILLDEPSTGLDIAAREQLLESIDLLTETHPDVASVLVTHHLEELPSSTTHALLLADGRVVSRRARRGTRSPPSTCPPPSSHPIERPLRRGPVAGARREPPCSAPCRPNWSLSGSAGPYMYRHTRQYDAVFTLPRGWIDRLVYPIDMDRESSL